MKNKSEKYPSFMTFHHGNDHVLEVTVSTCEITVTDVLRDFAQFLSACGYTMPKCDNPIILNYDDEYTELVESKQD